ncbi:TPA: hypothetical protein N0F65_002575 [Lagenidium giganteum]|uniref:Uncharacterized protein n=1 Tax=Lagenidium giganteum TaxID=4803 RepID=A0AAV2YXH1_9STRA|nr:TPA: hypothetical protein N0F65_002575 [Lagenidium giganteum]
MIRCGMSLDIDGKWSVTQYPDLQEIIKEFPDAFGGKENAPGAEIALKPNVLSKLLSWALIHVSGSVKTMLTVAFISSSHNGIDSS